jgi:hypothetical protein
VLIVVYMFFTKAGSAKSYIRGITRLARDGQKKRYFSLPQRAGAAALPSTLNTITVGKARSHNLSIIPQIKSQSKVHIIKRNNSIHLQKLLIHQLIRDSK